MVKFLVFLALLLGLSTASFGQSAAHLAGSYRMEGQGGATLELHADGTASLDGSETVWAATENQISIGRDLAFYTFKGDRLVLTKGTTQIVWKKVRSGKRQKGAQRDKSQPESDADREAKRVLTSTAWCSFTYNQTTGTSTTRRVVFRPDGTMNMNDGRETYSKGYGGTVAGQSNSAGTMRWKLENLKLFVDQKDGNGFQDIGVTASQNSNGYVILHAAGREYSMCK
jgi:hypothetical protein